MDEVFTNTAGSAANTCTLSLDTLAQLVQRGSYPVAR
jgi:hypothetical protein